VVVEHRNVVNLAYGLTEHWGIGPGSVMLQFAALAFDVSVKDMFVSLLAGARLVLAAPETLHSPPRLAALIRQTGITFASLPPAVLDLLPAGRYPELQVIMARGEELPTKVARRWIRPGLRLVNGYGPTETTVTAAFAELDATTPMPPPIGFPVHPNYRAYVLDQQLNPVPVGVFGELHIGGAGVARGYLNRPDLTRERFIPDPFTPGQRLHKSGDLVRAARTARSSSRAVSTTRSRSAAYGSSSARSRPRSPLIPPSPRPSSPSSPGQPETTNSPPTCAWTQGPSATRTSRPTWPARCPPP
jgi:non-ribosomal peptide synthetase component F